MSGSLPRWPPTSSGDGLWSLMARSSSTNWIPCPARYAVAGRATNVHEAAGEHPARRARRRRREDGCADEAGARCADYSDRRLSQSSAACATSRQPWSMVSEWPRSGNSMKSVMAGDLW
jgi:hypothetical protein